MCIVLVNTQHLGSAVSGSVWPGAFQMRLHPPIFRWHTTQVTIDLSDDFERHESWFLSTPRAPWGPLPNMYNLEQALISPRWCREQSSLGVGREMRGLGGGEYILWTSFLNFFFAKNESWLPSQQVLSKYTWKDGLEKCQDEHHCLENRGAFYIKQHLLGTVTQHHS